MSLLCDILNNKDSIYRGNLHYYFKQLFNSRGVNNPYHNIRHACTILIRCYQALQFYIEKTKEVDLELNRAFLISAICHDYNHSGRSGNDDLNIKLALRGVENIILDKDEHLLENIYHFISQTEFGPRGHVYESKSEYDKMIKDADLSQICSDAWIRMIIFGLAEEMGLSPIKMLELQESFLSAVRFESEWGQQFLPMLQEKIQESKELLKILNCDLTT